MTTLKPREAIDFTSMVCSSATAYCSSARGTRSMSPMSAGRTRRKSSRVKSRSILR